MKGDFTRSTFRPERTYSRVLLQQGRVQVDADWNEQVEIGHDLLAGGRRDLIGPAGGPVGALGFGITVAAGKPQAGAGRYYVDGVLVEHAVAEALDAQADLPGFTLPTTQGTYLAYLDVWEHLVTPLSDPLLRELALGGPDSAVRGRTLAQVKLLHLGNTALAGNCLTPFTRWTQLLEAGDGGMAARSRPDPAVSNPCLVPPGAGYRRLENQLYRVEVRGGGELGTATFVWSRENGSVAAGVEAQDGDDLVLAAEPRDQALGFVKGDWIELTDDARELRQEPGTLVRVLDTEGRVLTIDPATATGSTSLADFGPNPRARRWDSDGEQAVERPAGDDGWLALEDGIEIRFEPGTFRPGDHWMVPARTASGDVEWPRDASGPLAVRPHGVRHRYARLALLTLSAGTWSVRSDCRERFPQLTDVLDLRVVGGSGQEARPGMALPAPLIVGVSRGRWPVAGARVRFEAGAGQLQAGGEGPALAVDAVTDADGLAQCTWQLGTAPVGQTVTARLLDAGGQPLHLPVVFTAGLSVAGEVAYDPKGCERLAGASTVEEALDALCAEQGHEPEREPGIHVTEVSVLGPRGGRVPLRNDRDMPARALARGVELLLDEVVAPEAVDGKPVLEITVDLPFPTRGEDQELWGGQVVGSQRIVLAGTAHAQGESILWSPDGETHKFLAEHLMTGMRRLERELRVLAWLTLRGDFVFEPKVQRWVDGEAFGTPGDDGRTDVRLPSGDERRGGDLRMWFWLVEQG